MLVENSTQIVLTDQERCYYEYTKNMLYEAHLQYLQRQKSKMCEEK